jgi:hypothetical protein
VASEVSSGVSQATNPKKKKALKNLKSKLKMSDLEKLPTELLERVFLYCMNIDLPKSSPIIGAKLSSPTIFGKTLIAAFGPTWEKWHGKGGQLRPSSVDVVEPLQVISSKLLIPLEGSSITSLLFCVVVGHLCRSY